MVRFKFNNNNYFLIVKIRAVMITFKNKNKLNPKKQILNKTNRIIKQKMYFNKYLDQGIDQS